VEGKSVMKIKLKLGVEQSKVLINLMTVILVSKKETLIDPLSHFNRIELITDFNNLAILVLKLQEKCFSDRKIFSISIDANYVASFKRLLSKNLFPIHLNMQVELLQFFTTCEHAIEKANNIIDARSERIIFSH